MQKCERDGIMVNLFTVQKETLVVRSVWHVFLTLMPPERPL